MEIQRAETWPERGRATYFLYRPLFLSSPSPSFSFSRFLSSFDHVFFQTLLYTSIRDSILVQVSHKIVHEYLIYT